VSDKSIQLARLWLALDEVKKKINGEVLPDLEYLEATDEESARLAQALQQAASQVERYQATFKLQAVAQHTS
jgi:hypothetical protein